jgi:hypothetical protein
VDGRVVAAGTLPDSKWTVVVVVGGDGSENAGPWRIGLAKAAADMKLIGREENRERMKRIQALPPR